MADEKKVFKSRVSIPMTREFDIVGSREFKTKEGKIQYIGEFIEKDTFGRTFVGNMYADKPFKLGKQTMKVKANIDSFTLDK